MLLVKMSSLSGLHRCLFQCPRRGIKSLPFIKPYYPPRRGAIKSEWRSKQSRLLPVNKIQLPKDFTQWDAEFNKTLEFSSQVDSLKTRGFRRSYKPYEPPAQVDEIILSTLGEIYNLSSDVKADQIQLNDDLKKKTELLNILAQKTGHRVPNSFLHFMSNAEDLLDFYRTPIDCKNYYDRLISSENSLPKNLHAIKDYIRFDPSDGHPFHQVSAYPRSSTIICTPESKRRYKPV
uniref:Large ribosomal subunit protein mL50 n=1 Tax=Caligus clemensi TaxID=344056 RepID=C1C332_CALCM|nr:Mitochondrial 39S ribosomal protein L50 [Caligus clemensi]